ncbi:MAG: DUF1232 domain-containing protein [bacterium]
MKFFQKIKDIDSILREIKILYVAYTDRRTPRKAQVIAGVIIVLYFLDTFDVIPDFIPVFGILDDVIVVPIVAAVISRWFIPKNILKEARERVIREEQK